ncbi:Diphthamide biosynthesis protein 2 [Boothiomyces sp. JEL0866]|nr:Diphthamide biosynthesis protein 2 [Boothiomyces sp. JEL0866]
MEEKYDIELSLNFIRDKKNICLQFPDELLPDAPFVAQKLKTDTNSVYIMADTTFGPCCADLIAGQHANADAIIHYGPACLTKPAENSPPILYVFEKQDVDLEDLVDKLQSEFKDEKPVLVLGDTSTFHIWPALQAMLPQKHFIWSTIQKEIQNAAALSESIHGRYIDLPNNLHIQDCGMLYIGSDSLCLSNLIMSISPCSLLIYDPTRKETNRNYGKVNSVLQRRFVQMEKARDANVIGIVVGTLGVASYLNVVNTLKELIIASGKKPYILAVGKPNPAKLGNFPEIECFVLIACPENSILDSKEYYHPIVTPYELSLALDKHSQWTPSTYDLNLSRMVDNLSAQLEKTKIRASEGHESDDEPHFSLITGQYAVKKGFVTITNDEAVPGEYMVIKKEGGQLSKFVTANVGADYLNSRSFQGLEPKIGETEVKLAEEGRSGIAKNYN